MPKLKMKKSLIYVMVLSVLLSSCGYSVTKPLVENPNPYQAGSFEPLKRQDYTLLNNTMGEAKSNQFYVLFFPIGKSKTTQELESNAYYNAVENCKDADAVLLPKTEYKRFSIPLILLGYSSRKVTVKGKGIMLKTDAATTSSK